MSDLILDASFALCWCFRDESTERTESVLKSLQNQEGVGWVPAIWRYEMLNGLGKGVSRERLTYEIAVALWRELQVLPIRTVEVSLDETLLALALAHNLAIYDASYLRLGQEKNLPIATVDGKLQQAAKFVGLQVVRP